MEEKRRRNMEREIDVDELTYISKMDSLYE